MKDVTSAAEIRGLTEAARCRGESVGLVPTMGYLHAGHRRLIEEARAGNDLVVVSLYVNPTQFGPAEDFDRYPRDLEGDRVTAAAAGADVLFAPGAGTMYPKGPAGQGIWVEPGSFGARLCGASRPGHFRGVLTVVSKLFHLVRPHRAYFGQKDGQQAILIQRMVDDLALDIGIEVVPTVREPDGLALSSRNVYLSPGERSQATVLFRALQAVRSAVEAGERDPKNLERLMATAVGESPQARLDYAKVVDAETLEPPEGPLRRDAMAALAVYFGATRLIDNLMVRFRPGGPVFS
jgi:pantoate--beta-alanine ligase